MKFSQIVLIALLGTAVALPGYAQPGSGGGPGAGPGAGMGPGPGKGPAAKRPRFQFSQENTFGWKLMSAEEHSAHRAKMLSAKTYDECKAVQNEQHQQMQARAEEKHMTLAAPRQNACDRMKARGLLK
ncbi:MAG: hypothetical protein IH605_11420 [Burkholderiales bacterium]|nr:hypothetical protein [Burkholderiales bacterium]